MKQVQFIYCVLCFLFSAAVCSATELKVLYQYDRYGNPIIEKWRGNLSGDGKEEQFTIRRTFSPDEHRFLLEEENDDGQVVSFSYVPNTRLVARELIKERRKIIQRKFFIYDDLNNLVQEIVDNGSAEHENDLLNVTQRRITRYAFQQGRLETIEEKFWDGRKERYLALTRFVYDKHGNVSKLVTSGGGVDPAFYESRSYTPEGRVASKTNVCGGKSVFEYDTKKNCVLETRGSLCPCSIQSTYDQAGRLIQEKRADSDGTTFSKAFAYDPAGYIVREMDGYGNVTAYTRDPKTDKVVKTVSPPLCSKNGKPIPVTTQSTWDALGRETSRTDACGNVTTWSYNAYGSPTEIIDAEGHQESFRYTLSGRLKWHRSPGGLVTEYRYDAWGQVVSKMYSDASRSYGQETFGYEGFNLVKETDREGHVTYYAYDGAGRLICQEREGKETLWTYDAYGRIKSVVKGGKKTTYERNPVGQIIREQGERETVYKYDRDGQCVAALWHVDGKEMAETYACDAFGRKTSVTDREGHITTIAYDDAAVNALGQRVLQKGTTDPKGTTSLETFDVYGRCVSKETSLSRETWSYDPCGNLIEHASGECTTTYTYNALNLLTTATETRPPLSTRITAYTYTPDHQIKTKTKPDGTILSYRYSSFGYLEELISLDGRLHITYIYDPRGALLSASDGVATYLVDDGKIPFAKRFNILEEFGIKDPSGGTYDLNGNLVAQGTTRLWYDPLDRLVKVTTSRQITIIEYDPFNRRTSKVVYDMQRRELSRETYL